MIAERGLAYVEIPPVPYREIVPGPGRPPSRDVWLPWWTPPLRAAVPTFHNATLSTSTTVATSGACNKPTLSDGDWMIATVTHRTAETQNAPAGWDRIAAGYGNTSAIETWVKYIPVAASEVATNYTWTWTASVKWAITIMSVSGAAPTNTYDAFVAVAPQVNGASAAAGFGRIWSRATVGLSIVGASTAGGAVGYTAFNGWTSAGAFTTGSSSGPDTVIVSAYKAISVAAVPSANSFTLSTSRASQSIQILVRTASTPMPFVIRSSTASGNNATAAHGLALPTIWSPGDLGVYVFGNVKAAAATLSSLTAGWAQVGATVSKCNLGSTACVSQVLAVRKLQAGDASCTATWNASGSCSAMAVVVSLGDADAVALATLADTVDNSTCDIPGVTVEASAQEFWDFASIMMNRDTGPSGTAAGHSRILGVVRPGTSTTTLDWRGNTAANPGTTTLTTSNTGTSTALRFVIRPLATRRSQVILWT